MPEFTVLAVVSVVAVVAAELLFFRTGIFATVTFWVAYAIIVFFEVLVDGWLTKLSAPVVTLAVGATAAAWYLEYVRARASLAAGPGRQVITPGERPTRIVLTAVGLGLPPLALAALWGHVVIVGTSAVFLLAHSIRRLHELDRQGSGRPPAPT